MLFAELGLRPEILEAVVKLNFETPTPVQATVIPALLETPRDLVALAQTGTGKTAAFGLPLLNMLDLERAMPQALILCPTRELCMQIARDLQGFATGLPAVSILAVYGGADIQPQLGALQRGVHIVVATPGRMLDVLRRKKVDFSQVARVVLDEADEMLNMGFEEELEGILSTVPEAAQTLLFSATMPAEVAKISRKYMTNPLEFVLGTRNAGSENVSHEYYVVHAKDRYAALRRIVDVYPRMYGIVFCRTRIETQQVADHLTADGYNAQALHGDLSQLQRDSVMKKFHKRHVQILVATDVAARGLDVEDLTHVINYNMPDELNAYTHRSGRTGRAGKDGISVSIIHLREQHKIKQLERVVGKKFSRKPVPTGEEVSRARLISLATRVRDYSDDKSLVDTHIDELAQLLSVLSKEEIIKRFVSIELHRLLHFYKGAPDLNVTTAARSPRPEREPRPKRQERTTREPAETGRMVGLVMNVGSVNGLNPKKMMTLINVADRNRRVEIGRIHIVKKQAYFEVPEAQAQGVIESFAMGLIEQDGREVTVALAGSGYKDASRAKGRGQGGPRKRK
jgi:ATP-dependent RNA helicase DeaD